MCAAHIRRRGGWENKDVWGRLKKETSPHHKMAKYLCHLVYEDDEYQDDEDKIHIRITNVVPVSSAEKAL